MPEQEGREKEAMEKEPLGRREKRCLASPTSSEPNHAPSTAQSPEVTTTLGSCSLPLALRTGLRPHRYLLQALL